MKARTLKKATPQEIKRMSAGSRKYLDCSAGCGREVEASGDAKSIICPYCVQKIVAPPANIKTPEKDIEERPKGWQRRKEYISPSGKVYHKGRLVDESNTSDSSGGDRRNGNKVKEPTPVVIKRKRGRPRKNPQ